MAANLLAPNPSRKRFARSNLRLEIFVSSSTPLQSSRNSRSERNFFGRFFFAPTNFPCRRVARSHPRCVLAKHALPIHSIKGSDRVFFLFPFSPFFFLPSFRATFGAFLRSVFALLHSFLPLVPATEVQECEEAFCQVFSLSLLFFQTTANAKPTCHAVG